MFARTMSQIPGEAVSNIPRNHCNPTVPRPQSASVAPYLTPSKPYWPRRVVLSWQDSLGTGRYNMAPFVIKMAHETVHAHSVMDMCTVPVDENMGF